MGVCPTAERVSFPTSCSCCAPHWHLGLPSPSAHSYLSLCVARIACTRHAERPGWLRRFEVLERRDDRPSARLHLACGLCVVGTRS
eukprot:301350-Prymnesium_polylepis.4